MAQRLKLIKPMNAQIQLWRELKHADDRREQSLFLAEGFKVIQELYKSEWDIEALLVLDEKKERLETFLFAIPSTKILYGLTETQWDRLSQDRESEGLIAVVKKPPQKDVYQELKGHPDRLLLLHQVNNPNNLGALLRTAQWFGFDTVLLGTGSVDFTNPKVVRTSMGSLFHLNIVDRVDFYETMPAIKKDYFVIGSHVKKGIHPHPCKQKTALLLGSESHGIPGSLLKSADELWSIPGVVDSDSLSLPQAAAIMMYECASPFRSNRWDVSS
ncbi:MAG: RNA methyltransferase [Deltaproteobacteria bacterium]|nr:RNA methyltransferase [Deltaproteobacteria bacterium]